MRHWSQLGIRNSRVKPGRTAGAIGAITLGVAVVVWVTCAYESVRLSLRDQVWFWIGRSHLSVESMFGHTGTVFESLEDPIQGLPNVKHTTARLRQQVRLSPVIEVAGQQASPELLGNTVQAVGINPETEYYFRDYGAQGGEGRTRLSPEDGAVAVIERQLATQMNLNVGDRVMLRSAPTAGVDDGVKSVELELIGIIEHRRIAHQQDPIIVTPIEQVKKITQFADDIPRVTRIDIILKDVSFTALRRTEKRVRALVDAQSQGFLVTSAEPKIRQIKSAEQQTGLVLGMLSSVALFTGFFIILSTLSMGMVERVGQLGMLRCLGMTRFQIAANVLSEAVPMGVVGILLGIPTGIAMARISVWVVPEYITFAISTSGILLAAGGGAVTTLLGAAVPMVQAMRVSPLEASRPQARPPAKWLPFAVGMIGLAMLAGHLYLVGYTIGPNWVLQPIYPVGVVVLLYVGYALLTPALISIVSPIAVWLSSKLLGVRYRLLADQVGRVTWRSATICCGLMVGLSLIVSLVAHSRSAEKGWDFPKQFAEAFVYIQPPMQREQAQKLCNLKGIASCCLVNEGLRCTVYGKGLFHFPFSTFVAGDPEAFFDIAKLEFLEGNKEEAIRKLNEGGYVLVTPEFVRSQKLTYGDTVFIRLKGRSAKPYEFEIAGVVSSPALQIAANYFNASGMLTQQSVHIVMGTFQDAVDIFNAPDVASMFLINFDLPPTPVPAAFQSDEPPNADAPADFADMIQQWRPSLTERTYELDQIEKKVNQKAEQDSKLTWYDSSLLQIFRRAYLEGPVSQWSSLTPEQRWQRFREELVMRLLAGYSRSTSHLKASVRSLKEQINQDLRKATLLLTTVPAVALIVAGLGVANLMMANVAARTRQIAMLRAIGSTKSQITRLVIAEAIVLGSLGCLIGLALGLHGAASLNHIVTTIWGFKPEWTVPVGWVSAGIGFTMSICLIAGILPARYAARNNIIDALQTT